MKKHFFLSLITITGFLFSAQAQDNFKLKQTFFSLGTGINNNCGLLGIGLEQFVSEKVSFFGAAGIGSWGYKVTGGARLYLDGKTGNAFGLSYSAATGLEEVEIEVDALINNTEQKVKEKFKLNPVSVINLTWMKHWQIGNKSRFNLELGYSMNMSGKNNYTSKSGLVLTDKSKSVMDFIQPGGIIIGLGFSFGL